VYQYVAEKQMQSSELWCVMKRLKYLTLMVIILSLLLTSCISILNRKKIPPCSGIVELTHPYIKYLGRSVYEDGKVIIDDSCAGFELNIKGAGVKVKLNEVSSETNKTYFAVFVNGKRSKTITLLNGENEYVLAEKLTLGNYNIRLMKLSEARFTQSDLTSIEIQGELTKRPADKSRKIEFIGDSLTAGFGNLAQDPNKQYDSGDEDATQAYDAVAAGILNADFNVLAVSGWGVSVDCIGNKNDVLPALYGFAHYFRNLTLWDFNSFKPDVVVINLGTNDFSAKVSASDFSTAVGDFTSTITKKNPNAKIVWCYGFATVDRISEVEAAVKKSAESNKNVYFVSIPTMDMAADGVGALYHPSLKSHAKAGKFLADELKRIMVWK
jgi:lysophospholipase L1-like esterase